MKKKKTIKEDESQKNVNQFKWFGLIYEVPSEMNYDDNRVDGEYQLFPVWARNENEAKREQQERGLPEGQYDEYTGEEFDTVFIGSTILSDEDLNSLGISIEDLEKGGNAPEAYSDECTTYTGYSPGENSIEDILVGMGLGSDDYMRDEKGIYGGYHLVRNKTGKVNLMDVETGKPILNKWLKAIRPINVDLEWDPFNKTISGKYIAEGTLDGKKYFLIDANGKFKDLGGYKVQGFENGSLVLKSKNGYNILGPDDKLKFKKDIAHLSKNFSDDTFNVRRDADGPIGIYNRKGNSIVGSDRGYNEIDIFFDHRTLLARSDRGYEILDRKTGKNVFGTYFDEEPKDYAGGNDMVVLHSPEKGYGLSNKYTPSLIGGRWSEKPIQSINIDNNKNFGRIVLIFTINGKEYAFYENRFFPKERIQNYLNNRESFDTAAKNRDSLNTLDRVRKQYPGEDFNKTERYFTPDQGVDFERATRDPYWDPYKNSDPKVRNKRFRDKDWKPGEYQTRSDAPMYDLSDNAYNAARDKVKNSKIGNNSWYDTEVPGETKFQESRVRGGKRIRINESDVRKMVLSSVKIILENLDKRKK